MASARSFAQGPPALVPKDRRGIDVCLGSRKCHVSNLLAVLAAEGVVAGYDADILSLHRWSRRGRQAVDEVDLPPRPADGRADSPERHTDRRPVAERDRRCRLGFMQPFRT
jgi:hypothetical protein